MVTERLVPGVLLLKEVLVSDVEARKGERFVALSKVTTKSNIVPFECRLLAK